MADLPEWAVPGRAPALAPAAGASREWRLLRRALGRIVRSSVILLGGEEKGGGGLLAALDARSKILGLLVLIVAATLSSRVETLAAVVAGAWLLAAGSGLDLRRYLVAVSVVPLFTVALALPACLNVVTNGPSVWTLVHYPAGSLGPWRWPENLAVTAPGLAVAARFVLRSTACVSLAALAAASTPASELLAGLRSLGVPGSFVMAAGMMARYLGLLLRGAEEIHLAKLSRSLGGVTAGRDQAWTAASVGEIFRHSRALAEEVTRAMVSRGYSGEARALREPSLRTGDWVFLAAAVAAAGMVVWAG